MIYKAILDEITRVFTLFSDLMKLWFFQKAIIVSIIAAIVCAIIGTFIVVKRISMITGSISHATFGGLGISYFLGFNPIIGAIVFGLACGGSIAVLQKKKQNRLDTILSFLWAFGMAIGLVFVSLSDGYRTDLFTYLFGNILLISNSELLTLLIINLCVLKIIGFMFNTLVMVFFDEEFAEVRNIPIMLINLIFYSLIALTIVSILLVVGIVLLIAYLTIPPAIGLFFYKSIKKVMVASGLILIFSSLLGLFLGAWLSLPPSPLIILTLSLLYLLAFIFSSMRNRAKTKIDDIQAHACELEIESFGLFEKYIQDGIEQENP